MEQDVPPEQKGKYEKLLKTLVRQGLTLEKRKSQRKDENDQIVDFGRHTYMPSTCRSFVYDNIKLISDKNLQVLIDYLQDRNMDRPKEEYISDRIDSETWQHMLVDLQGEMMNRRTTACRK